MEKETYEETAWHFVHLGHMALCMPVLVARHKLRKTQVFQVVVAYSGIGEAGFSAQEAIKLLDVLWFHLLLQEATIPRLP